MEIITRTAAIKKGLNVYFTGKPCKNGHVAERYVQSCTCKLCIHTAIPTEHNPDRQRRSDERLELEREKVKLASERVRLNIERLQLQRQRREEKQYVAETKSQLTKMRYLVFHEDIQALRQFAHLLALARVPHIRYGDVACPHVVPGMNGGGVGRYTLACFPEDQDTLLQYSKQLFSAQNAVRPVKATVAANRKARHDALMAQLNEGDGSWPTGDPR